jgi:melanoma-associated antigen
VDSDGPSDAQRADQRLAIKLVRYALSCEYARQPIRRDGIKEKGEIGQSTRDNAAVVEATSADMYFCTAVLGTQGRSFKRIFALAQEQLRFVFGMEMQELPVREKMTLQEKRKGTSPSAHTKSNGQRR